MGPSSNQWKNKTNTSALIEKYYRDIPTRLIEQVREVYAIDFEMFGYDKYLPFERIKDHKELVPT